MLSAVFNGMWIWCRILRLRYRESFNVASPKLKTLRGFKGPGTELSMICTKLQREQLKSLRFNQIRVPKDTTTCLIFARGGRGLSRGYYFAPRKHAKYHHSQIHKQTHQIRFIPFPRRP